jgi:hypothetical protein
MVLNRILISITKDLANRSLGSFPQPSSKNNLIINYFLLDIILHKLSAKDNHFKAKQNKYKGTLRA